MNDCYELTLPEKFEKMKPRFVMCLGKPGKVEKETNDDVN
jgi:hypothetical protein